MKTTSIAVLALISASALAQPVAVSGGGGSRNIKARDIAPSDLTDLEARKIHINWGKAGNVFKGAAKIGASLLFRRNEDGDVYLVTRDLIDDDGELLARDFDDDYLEARDLTDLEARKIHINWGKVGKFFKGAAKVASSILFKRDEDGNVYLVARDPIDDDGELLARDFDDDYLEARDIEDYLETRGFDDEYLEARDFDDEYLEARDFDDEYLEARDFDDEYLEARDFDDEYLEARDFDLEERSRFSELGHLGRAFRHGGPARRIHFHGHAQQQQDNDNERRDLEERSRLGTAGRIGGHLFRHADQIHTVASYIPQRNQNQNQNQPRDLVEEGGLYDLD